MITLDAMTVLRGVVQEHVEQPARRSPIVLLIGPPACGKTVGTDDVCRQFALCQDHVSGVHKHMFFRADPKRLMTVEMGRPLTPRQWGILADRPEGILVVIHMRPDVMGLPAKAQGVQLISLPREEGWS